MPYRLDRFSDVGLSQPLLDVLIDEQQRAAIPRLRRLWRYYRNPTTGPRGGAGAAGAHPTVPWRGAGRFRLAQEDGLPARLGGGNGAGWWAPADPAGDDRAGAAGREIVIENDIAWRIHTMVDFLFGRPVRFVSLAADPALRARIERALHDAWQASGGIALLQDLALLGHVYGHVDLVVRAPATAHEPARAAAPPLPSIEVVEPTRAVPLLSPRDFRAIDAYVIRFQRESTAVEPGWTDGLLARAARRVLGLGATDPTGADGRPRAGRRRLTTVTEILSGSWRQVYECDGDDDAPADSTAATRAPGPRLVLEEPNRVSPGRAPVVHIQNQSQPFAYDGLGEVEPLIPLQDELNTRLSDRASRVTLQSFKMYLAKGIDTFDRRPVAPGALWTTDNPDASIEAFGGDAASPSEDRHIDEIREALDKTSGVPPLATGVVRAKVGNLTSENALRITLTGLLTRTARKRVAYGRGLADACRLVLSALHESGDLPTTDADRAVSIDWPDPLPRDEESLLRAARAKADLGVPAPQVLAELGYPPRDDID
jgi:hypothetical protein